MIFLSYAQKDGTPYVEHLETALQAAGFETWRDTSNLHPASRIDVTIEDSIKQAESVVVCITADVERDKSFVRNEIAYASVLDKPIIIARFENVPPPISIVNRFWIEFHKQTWDTAFAELHKWLKQPFQEQKRLKDGASASAVDPFRDYVESAYEFIVEGLRQRIIVPIDLKAKDTPDAVNPPPPPKSNRNIFEQSFSGVKMGTAEPKPEKRDFSTFREWFDYFEGRALLLGEPGAGKTITLMAYARDAYAARLDDPKQPLPLYNLVPTWDAEKRTPLHEWIAETHGLDADAVKREMVAGGALLLLDGLDELGGEREIRDDKGELIEIYDPRLHFLDLLPPNNRILLTSRVREYNEIGHRATLNGAIRLQPLDDNQIGDYLYKQPELLTLLESDEQLRELTRTPLLMSIFAYAYRDLPESERQQLVKLKNAYELREKIFMRYIDQRYEHEQVKLNASLPFALDKLKEMLGRLAMQNAAHRWRRDNVLYESELEDVCDPMHLASFIELTVRLNILVRGDDVWFRFIHLLLRDVLVFDPALQCLSDPSIDIRFTGIDALERITDPRSVEPLVRTLSDPRLTLRRRAAEVLEKIGVPAVEPLAHLLSDPSATLRRRAAEILGKIGVPAVEALVHVLFGRIADMRHKATDILGEIADPRAVEPLAHLLSDPSAALRRRAAIALGKIADPRAVEPLICVLADPNADVRRCATIALGKIADPRALESLGTLLYDPDSDIRVSAIAALGRIGPPAVKLLIDNLDSAYSDTGYFAAHFLAKIGTNEALEALRKWRESHEKS